MGQAKEKSGDGNTEQMVLRLENEGREATLKNDVAATERLLADNWINVNADGSVTTKAKLLELLKAGSFTIQSIENDEVIMRVFGDAAVVTGRSTTKRSGEVARSSRARFVSPASTPKITDDGWLFRHTTHLSEDSLDSRSAAHGPSPTSSRLLAVSTDVTIPITPTNTKF